MTLTFQSPSADLQIHRLSDLYADWRERLSLAREDMRVHPMALEHTYINLQANNQAKYRRWHRPRAGTGIGKQIDRRQREQFVAESTRRGGWQLVSH